MYCNAAVKELQALRWQSKDQHSGLLGPFDLPTPKWSSNLHKSTQDSIPGSLYLGAAEGWRTVQKRFRSCRPSKEQGWVLLGFRTLGKQPHTGSKFSETLEATTSCTDVESMCLNILTQLILKLYNLFSVRTPTSPETEDSAGKKECLSVACRVCRANSYCGGGAGDQSTAAGECAGRSFHNQVHRTSSL